MLNLGWQKLPWNDNNVVVEKIGGANHSGDGLALSACVNQLDVLQCVLANKTELEPVLFLFGSPVHVGHARKGKEHLLPHQAPLLHKA